MVTLVGFGTFTSASGRRGPGAIRALKRRLDPSGTVRKSGLEGVEGCAKLTALPGSKQVLAAGC